MDNLYSQLEAQVTALINQCETLKQANAKLKQIKFSLLQEKEILQAKHNATIQKIEEMVSRLKSIEPSL
jgi:uncharacterized protein (TIGR02449 family)